MTGTKFRLAREIQLAQSPLTAPVAQFLTERSLLGRHES
jgi:hypothetical protein